MCPLTPTLVPKIVIKLQVLVPDYWGAPCSCQPGEGGGYSWLSILLHLELTEAAGCMCGGIFLFGSFRMRRPIVNLDYLKLEETP